jgi:MFS family permease
MLLYAATAIEALGYGAIFALLAELQDEYDLPTYGLGLIAGSSFLAALGAQVGLARYADRGRTRLMLRLGLATCAVGMVWFGVANQLWEFVGARVLLGVGSGMFVPAARRIVVTRAGDKSGEALGRLASVEVGGFIAGPPIAAALAGLFGLHVPFLVLAGALAFTAPAVARLEEPPVHDHEERRVVRVLLARRGVRAGLALAAALYLSIGVFDAIWARYMTDLGADTTLIAITLTLFALPLVALSPLGGRISDRRGPLRAAVVALAVTVPLVVAYGFVRSLAVVCAIAVLHSVCDALTTPASQSTVARCAPEGLAASGQGLYGAVAAAAAAVAAFGAAPLYQVGGAEVMWAAAGAGVTGLTALAYVWGRGTPADHHVAATTLVAGTPTTGARTP